MTSTGPIKRTPSFIQDKTENILDQIFLKAASELQHKVGFLLLTKYNFSSPIETEMQCSNAETLNLIS